MADPANVRAGNDADLAGSARHPAAAEPSMEDILASIRRILNDDTAAAPGDAPGDAPDASEDDDVLVLDDTMLAKPANDHLPDLKSAPSAPMEVPAMADIVEPTASDSLLAPQTRSAAEAALSGLMQTIADERAPSVYRNGPTLEDLVREEMRPMLKAWLDTQLPAMVERLVRIEIERLTAKL